MRRPVRALVAVLASAALLAGAGCQSGSDEEMTPRPRRTVTATLPPSAAPAPQAPDRVPVGQAALSTTDVVWAQGTRLHVNKRATDLSPYVVEGFVAVRGGIYVLSDNRVWFTDFSRVRDTGLAFVASLGADAQGTRLRVARSYPGGTDVLGYDTDTGREVRGSGVRAVTKEERLGRRVTVDVAGDRVTPREGTDGTLEAREGGGDLGVAVTPAGRPVPYDATNGRRLRLTGLPARFDLAGWVGPDTFYGLSLQGGRPRSVVRCDRREGRCEDLGRVGAGPVVFGSGV